MSSFEFKDPQYLFLLIPYFIFLAWFLFRKLYNRESAIAVPSKEIINIKKSFRTRTYRFLPIFRFLSIFLLILAVAAPGRGVNYSSVKNLGIDIMIALDVSGSMRGQDFLPKNRLTVAKKVIRDFVSKRKTDRVGLVVFAGEAYLQCPLTIEHKMVNELIDEINFDSVDVDGTAIGDAVALSASRMMESKSKSKIILLLTDGVNNKGKIDPETAGKTCKDLGIKIYSVGIGKNGRVPYPNPGGIFFKTQYMMNQFDPAVLKSISSMTGGKFFRATSSGVLWQNIKDIDMLEKSEVELKQYHRFYGKFQRFLIVAAILFLIEIVLRTVVYRKLP